MIGLAAAQLVANPAFAEPGIAGPAGEPRSLLNSCWTPATLAATPAEKTPRRSLQKYELPLPTDPPYVTPAPAALRGVVRRVKLATDRKLIALTFDLCEQPGEVAGYDGAIVDYLRREGVKATFFAGGKWLRSHAERARQLIADPLVEIGNHSEAHRNLRRLKGTQLENEITGPQQSYAAIREQLSQSQCVRAAATDAMTRVAAEPALFRFPYGACNPAALDAVSKLGLTAVQWDFSTGDPDPRTSAVAIARTILQRARPGSILVAHANGRGWHTAEALTLVVPKLRAKGFEFVTVSELLAAGEPVIEQRCYDNHPGDTDRYDLLLAHRARPANPWTTTILP